MSDIENEVPKGVEVSFSEAELKAAIDEAIAVALTNSKANLDKSFKERDAALRKAVEAEAKLAEAEAKRLESEGKATEALQLRLAEQEKRMQALSQANMHLTRDTAVRHALTGLPFKNQKAAEMAYRDLVEGMIQDDGGSWAHKSGTAIEDYAKTFMEDPSNAFLFTPKQTSGGGSPTTTTTGTPNLDTPLLKKTQAEILMMAIEGKLPNQG